MSENSLYQLHQQTQRFLEQFPMELHQFSEEDFQYLLQELQNYQVELSLQNDQLRNTRHKLEITKRKYSDLYHYAPVGYFTLDENECVQETNVSGAALLGYAYDDLIDKPLSSFIHSEDQDIYREHFEYLRNTKSTIPHSCELKMVRHNDEIFFARLDSIAVETYEDDSGDLGKWRTVLTDITKSKQLDALRKSEARYRAVVEDQTELICRFDTDGKFTFVNNAFCRYYNKTHQELLGDDIWSFVHSEDKKKVRKHLKLITLEKPFHKHENRATLPNGKMVWQEWVDRAIFDEENNIIEYQSVGRDITKNKLMQEALLESEERFRTIADFTYDWEYWLGPDQNLIYISPSCERITGYRPEDFIRIEGLLKKIVHPRDAVRMDKHFRDETESEEPFEVDFRVMTRTGEVRWIGHKCQTVYDENGNILGRRASNRDITERIQAEMMLKMQRDLAYTLSSTNDIIEALDSVLITTMQLDAIDSGGVFLVDYQSGELNLVSHKGLLREFASAVSSFPADAPITRLVMIEKPIYGLFSDLPFLLDKNLLQRESLSATSVVPIAYKNKIIAAMMTASHTHKSISDEVKVILEAIAAQIGGAIARIEAEIGLQKSQKYQNWWMP